MTRSRWLTILTLATIARFAIAPFASNAFAEDAAQSPPQKITVTRAAGADWPCFLGSTGDGKSTERGIITDWPAAGPKIVWQRKITGGFCAPVVSQGRLFLFERQKDQARLNCLESETGKFLWKFEYVTSYVDIYGYDGGPRSCPVVDDDRVYILGPEGIIHCLAVADGKELWKVDTVKKYGVVQNFFGVGATPVIEGDLLITQVGGSPADEQDTAPGQLVGLHGNGSGIVAFGKRTGEVKYSITDQLASYASPTLATIDGRRWCFVFARGDLVGFDPASGKVDFEYPWRAPVMESVCASNPVVVGQEVFISETYGPGSSLLKVKPGGYDVVWADSPRVREKAMQTHWSTPIYVDGYLYGSSGRHTEQSELRAIEWSSGKVMWSEPDLTRCSLLYVDGHFVCLGEDGALRLIRVNPKKFELVAKTDLPIEGKEPNAKAPPARLLRFPAWAAPILSHGLLYVRGRDRLVCLELIPAK